MSEVNVIAPQEGYQMQALSSSADIVIGGGSAGSGKTFSLLLEPLRHIGNKDFGGVIFRRTYKQIHAQGGLWDTSQELYSCIPGSKARESESLWNFPSGSKLKFNHLEYEKNVTDWQGSQIPFIGFDELTHFTEKMFFYLLSRNRSTCGVRPYVRATCNPDPDSWVSDLIKWWIDQDTGLPIPERSGVVRYFIKDKDSYIWGDTVEECLEQATYLTEMYSGKMKGAEIDPRSFVKSLTFISGDVYSNKKLLEVNPEYLGNLLSQDDATRSQLLDGNWKVKLNEHELYDYAEFLNTFTNTHIKQRGTRRITADIALKGSDKFIVGVWEGSTIIHIEVVDKSDGKDVVDKITELKNKYKVRNSNIIFDNDGVGGFVDGWIKNAIEFKNGSKALKGENYFNLKTQCFYKSSDRFNDGGVHIPEHVGSQMYDETHTIRQRLIKERKVIRRDKPDGDRKMMIISKAEMKVLLQGTSPDLMDMIMMFEYFFLKPKAKAPKAKVYE